MWDSPETGDLAQVAEGRGAMQPYPPLRKYKFVGDDMKTLSRPNKKLKTKIPEIAMLRQNEWLGDLTETWGGSPFIYVTPVAAPILQVLQNLSAHSIPIPTIPIFDIKHGSVANPPSTATVFKDFHVLYNNIINYTDLCVRSSVAKDSTAKVLAMLKTSALTTECCPGHRMVGVFDFTATDYGLRCCRLDCKAMVAENVGEGPLLFFPRPPIDPGKLTANSLVKEIRKRHASQAKHLETVGESPWMSSCICPQGWFSELHMSNEHNLSWWGIRHPHPSSGSPDLTITEALEHLTDLQLIHETGPCASILPLLKDLIMGPLFPVEKKLELLRVVDDDCKLWKIAHSLRRR
ncbi:hypothetical protein B0H10DRAFT_2029539 [Mycena sp. CBHHK59/15]|nr:hypothetical protein B0H10DRAFT_2029539 [Mycena sp. CBHHK59/15]